MKQKMQYIQTLKQFSMPGITSIATYVDGGNNFFKLLIVMAIAWVSSFVISFAMNKKEQ